MHVVSKEKGVRRGEFLDKAPYIRAALEYAEYANQILAKMAIGILLLFCTLACSLAAAEPSTCSAILKAAGASDRFADAVGHGIHSITLEELRKFEPSASENNAVPTINRDLTSDIPILPHAPHAEKPEGKSFQSGPMQTIDRILRHMDNKKYDVAKYSPLERVVHAFHMQEVLDKAHQRYQEVKARPPSVQVCQCARDVSNNGVLDVLRIVALELREPTLVYGNHKSLPNGGLAEWLKSSYVNSGMYIRRLLTPGDGMITLQDERSWQLLKDSMMKIMEQTSDAYELALYLYCALHV